MKLTMLGTGNALVTECYNTCFVIEDSVFIQRGTSLIRMRSTILR
jgi:hypothetical protein